MSNLKFCPVDCPSLYSQEEDLEPEDYYGGNSMLILHCVDHNVPLETRIIPAGMGLSVFVLSCECYHNKFIETHIDPSDSEIKIRGVRCAECIEKGMPK